MKLRPYTDRVRSQRTSGQHHSPCLMKLRPYTGRVRSQRTNYFGPGGAFDEAEHTLPGCAPLPVNSVWPCGAFDEAERALPDAPKQRWDTLTRTNPVIFVTDPVKLVYD